MTSLLDEDPALPAVKLQELYKIIRKNNRVVHILNGLTMKKCFQNKIYVLYGAIKSGKSTVLRIVFNLMDVDAGSVHIFGRCGPSNRNTSNIGYMPQQSGIEDWLTVQEMTAMFASLYGMKPSETADKLILLKECMAMSDLSVSVGSLQEHQKRILSFFIASMHAPDLLLMDEPTSGCDPVYKHFIWRQIRQMVSQQRVTVLLTSSDESDCQWADIMGYIRNGRIIAEDSVSVLLQRYSVPTLSQMLYCVAIAEHISPENVDIRGTSSWTSIQSGGFTVSPPDDAAIAAADPDPHCKADRLPPPTACDWLLESFAAGLRRCRHCLSWRRRTRRRVQPRQKSFVRRIRVMCRWKFIVCCRRLLRTLAIMLLPLLCLYVYYSSVGGMPMRVHIGVVGQLAKNIFCSAGALTEHHECSRGPTELMYFETEPDALKYSKYHLLNAIIWLPDNNTADLRLDKSSMMISNYITTYVAKKLQVITSSNRNLSTADGYYAIDESPMSSRPIPGTEGVRLLWGCLTTVIHYCGMLIGTLPLIDHQMSGALERQLLLGIPWWEQLLAHTLVSLLYTLGLCALAELGVVLMLPNPDIWRARDLAVLFLLMLNLWICGYALGLLLFAIFSDYSLMLRSAFAFEVIAATVSGFLWHPASLSTIMMYISDVLPLKNVADGLTALVWKNVYVDSAEVWPALAVPVIWTVVCTVLHFALLPDDFFSS